MIKQILPGLFILLLIVFPLGQLGRINLLGSEVVLHLNDLLVGLTVIGVTFFRKAKLWERIKEDPLTKPLLIWSGVMLLSWLVNLPRLVPRESFISILYLVRWTVYAGLYYAVPVIKVEKKTVYRLLIVSVAAIALMGILQYSFLPDVTFLAAQDWDDHYYRIVGAFLDPGFTGAILALGVVLLYLKRKTGASDFLVLFAIYVSFALTYSRASYLLYLVAFATIAYFKKSVKIFIVAALLLTITIILLPRTPGEGTKLSRENSIWARLGNWKQTVSVWKDYPIFGVGFNTYRYVQRDRGWLNSYGVATSHSGAGADSSLLLVLATTGIVGFATYLFLLWRMWVVGKKSVLFAASFLGVVIHSWFNNTLMYPWIMEWLWIVLALSWNT